MICFEEQVEGCKQRSCSGNRSYETFEAVEEQFIAHFLWTVGQYWFVGRFLEDFLKVFECCNQQSYKIFEAIEEQFIALFWWTLGQ